MKKMIAQTVVRIGYTRIKTYFIGLIVGIAFLNLTVEAARAQSKWPHVVPSRDGIPISFEIHGSGEPVLVFVHGWSCDSRYWRAQTSYFSKMHRVVVLDLAGHGHSGMMRRQYAMSAFGEDVRAVTEAAGGRSVILIGHSMGGSVSRRPPGSCRTAFWV